MVCTGAHAALLFAVAYHPRLSHPGGMLRARAPAVSLTAEQEEQQRSWQRVQRSASERFLPRLDVLRSGEAPAPWRLPPAYRAMLAQLLVNAATGDEGALAARRAWDAFVFALRYHRRQYRASGEPYVTHPLEVASMLAKAEADLPSIMTGLLHDTVEDTRATLELVTERFGPEVSALVDGVTKLSRLELAREMQPGVQPALQASPALKASPADTAGGQEPSRSEKQAANLRKLVLAMSQDIRVLVVKLTDRTHNMRTLRYVGSHSSRRLKAEETMGIFAPLALRIGMYTVEIGRAHV